MEVSSFLTQGVYGITDTFVMEQGAALALM